MHVDVRGGLSCGDAVALLQQDAVRIEGRAYRPGGASDGVPECRLLFTRQIEDRLNVSTDHYERVALHSTECSRGKEDARHLVFVHNRGRPVPWVPPGEVLAVGTWRLLRNYERHGDGDSSGWHTEPA